MDVLKFNDVLTHIGIVANIKNMTNRVDAIREENYTDAIIYLQQFLKLHISEGIDVLIKSSINEIRSLNSGKKIMEDRKMAKAFLQRFKYLLEKKFRS